MINWTIKSQLFEKEPGIFKSFDELARDFLLEDKIQTNWSQIIEYESHKFYFVYDARFDTFGVNVPDFSLRANTPLNSIQSALNLAEEFQNVCDLLITQSVHDS